jgi:hypothetical protein
MSETIKPCPFCGGIGILGGMMPWVQCDDCDASGPSCADEAEATDEWNKRPEETALRARAEQDKASIAALEASLARCNENRDEWIATHRQDAKRIAELEAENGRLREDAARWNAWIERNPLTTYRKITGGTYSGSTIQPDRINAAMDELIAAEVWTLDPAHKRRQDELRDLLGGTVGEE